MVVAFISCNGQTNTSVESAPTDGQPKIIKNHFLQFPDEYFFVQCGLQDRKGNMWFGTAGNGIYVYDGKSFLNFTHKSFVNFKLKEDLNHNDILCCLEDKNGNIWFGTRRGLIRYKPTKEIPGGKDFSLYLIPENTINDSSHTRLPYTMQTGENFVWSIMQDKSGKIWFGTSIGVYIHDPLTDNDNDSPLFHRFIDDKSLINKNHFQLTNISMMLQDRFHNIWFVSAWAKADGIVRYDGKTLINFTPDNNFSFRSIIERKNGDLLFLSPYNGIYSFDGKTFSNIDEKIGVKDTLLCMLEDKNENLWLGHGGNNIMNDGDGGLWFFNGKTTSLITTQDGLSHNHVFCIIPDRDGNIWFGTRKTGLCRYDGKKLINYTDK